jgi:NAD(P)H-dependent FMN reductase
MNVISVIVGSTREGRFSERPAHWIFQHLRKRAGIDARLLDLRDFPMPFFDQPVTPATPGRPAFKNEVVQRWTAAIAQSDGFVFVTPEYNYGPSAVLKNAIDWVYPEWHRKAVCFVSYGSAAGVRSVQQLRQSVIEIQLAPIRSSVHGADRKRRAGVEAMDLSDARFKRRIRQYTIGSDVRSRTQVPDSEHLAIIEMRGERIFKMRSFRNLDDAQF